jgi:hypothetical protein
VPTKEALVHQRSGKSVSGHYPRQSFLTIEHPCGATQGMDPIINLEETVDEANRRDSVSV